MAVINYDLVRWSLKKWLFVIVLIIGLHLGLLWQFSAPPPLPAQASVAMPRVAVAPPQALKTDSIITLQDPLLFASAHPNGFSGAAWVKKPQRNYALRARLPNPTFLDAATARTYFPEELPSPVLVARNIPRARPGSEIPAAGSSVSRKSELRLEGALAERRLARPVEVPVQRHNDAVGNTVVEAGVAADGFVLAARIITPSGSKKADQDALAISRSLRFKPLISPGRERPAETLTWGKLIFDWFALDLAGTNAPPK